MTPEQLAALKVAVLNSADQAVVAAASSRNDTELSRLLNLPSTFVVWRLSTSADDISEAILWERLTPVDVPDGSAIQTNRLLLCQAKQMNLQVLLQGRVTVATGRSQIRTGFSDALTNVPSGVGGQTQDAGWIGASRVKATITRFATAAERVFATGAGTAGVPGVLGFEGTVSIDDIGKMMNAG